MLEKSTYRSCKIKTDLIRREPTESSNKLRQESEGNRTSEGKEINLIQTTPWKRCGTSPKVLSWGTTAERMRGH